MIEQVAVLLVIYGIVAAAVISRSITVMGMATMILTIVMALVAEWWAVLASILGIIFIGLYLLYVSKVGA